MSTPFSHPPLSQPTTVLLTGATSGIGAALLRRLLAQGHSVIALSRSAAYLPAQPGLIAISADLTDLPAIPALAHRLIADHPALSVLINNAAVQHAHALTDPASTPARLIEEATLNLAAPALLTQALLPHLMAQRGGAIVNLSSGLAIFPKQQGGLYSATKAGLSSFTTTLRWQVEGAPLLVTEVVLPLVDTPMTAGRGKGKITADHAARAILDGITARRSILRIGAARALPLIAALAPWMGRRLLRRA